jgi:hypothetical protein
MAGDSTFNQLVRELSPKERENLLSKVKNQIVLNAEPLYVDKIDAPVETEEAFARLPWYQQLIFSILSLFSTKSPLKLYEDKSITNLGRVIDAQAPGVYDQPRSLLLPELYNELVNLKESARFFFSILDASIGYSRGAFYAFLGSLEMEEVHNRLVVDTDPDTLVAKNPEASLTELRRIAYRQMESAIDLIHENQRTAMYEDIQSLYCLKQLASFVFDRLILAFGMDTSVDGMACSALPVRDLLSNLNNILFSFKKIPSRSLIESLFVFMLQDIMEEPGFNINAETEKFLAKAESSLGVIRKFNQTIPLTFIVRCISRDLSLCPALVSGGEDWLAVYRDYWKRFVKDRFAQYAQITRSRKLKESFQSFFKGADLKTLKNAASEDNPNGIPVKEAEALGLSLLRTYHAIVLAGDSAAVLNVILINGEFYNRDNQLEFSWSYNELNKLEEVINAFDEQLSPPGDFGLRYMAAREETKFPAQKRQKMQEIIDRVNRAGARIIEQSKNALIAMGNVLDGIIKKDPANEKYGALNNFAKLAVRGTAFTENLFIVAQSIQAVLTLLDQINSQETESPE